MASATPITLTSEETSTLEEISSVQQAADRLAVGFGGKSRETDASRGVQVEMIQALADFGQPITTGASSRNASLRCPTASPRSTGRNIHFIRMRRGAQPRRVQVEVGRVEEDRIDRPCIPTRVRVERVRQAAIGVPVVKQNHVPVAVLDAIDGGVQLLELLVHR